eukprot:6173200-Pleurochrysis_carterae.AAC.7
MHVALGGAVGANELRRHPAWYAHACTRACTHTHAKGCARAHTCARMQAHARAKTALELNGHDDSSSRDCRHMGW